MPVSEKKLNANRENAKKSTGPRTPEGKAKVAQNARKRYTTDLRLSPSNEDGDFLILRLQLTNDLQPQGVMQEIMVERIATIVWKLRRIELVEQRLIESASVAYEEDLASASAKLRAPKGTLQITKDKLQRSSKFQKEKLQRIKFQATEHLQATVLNPQRTRICCDLELVFCDL